MGTARRPAEADRLERERVWQDERFAHAPGRGPTLSSFTAGLTMEALRRVYAHVKTASAGKSVLDYGCSMGEASLLLSSYGAASVEGIDLSPVAVSQAEAAARAKSVNNVSFQVMNAESLEFADDAFDIVFGIGIIHHLNVDKACGEIARVLKPGGFAVFLEPLGHNPFINAVRRATPGSRTEDEHPLRLEDLDACSRHFGRVELEFVNFLTLLAAPLIGVPGRERLRALLNGADKRVLRLMPFLGRYAWNVVVRLESPRSPAPGTT
jgi:SAM-dependent methyltransferase